MLLYCFFAVVVAGRGGKGRCMYCSGRGYGLVWVSVFVSVGVGWG